MAGMFNSVRRRVGAFIGGFEGALGSRRLRNFQATRAHVNALIAASGPEMGARSRFLVRNNGYARQAVESRAANAVGTGIVPSPLIADPKIKEMLKSRFQAWTDESDAEGLTDFYGQQRRAAREAMAPGEVFIRFRTRRPSDGLTVPLQLQMLPSEQLSLAKTETLPNGNEIRQGIEFNGFGQRVAYHFYRRHPGDWTDRAGVAGEMTRIPANDIIHLFDPFESGQIRGVSDFSAALVKLYLLDIYDDAELDRKKMVSLAGVALRKGSADQYEAPGEEENAVGEREIDLKAGALLELNPGEDLVNYGPAESGQSYEPFQYRALLQISAALGIPYAYLSGDMLKANYSNSRLNLLEFRRRMEAWQHAVMVFQLCRPVWRRWLDTAVLSGSIVLPDYEPRRAEYQAVEWLPPRWDWMDPQKDARGELEQIQGGLKSRRKAVAERGLDVEQIDRERAEDLAREIKLGLVQTMPTTEPITPDSGQQPAPAPAEG